MRQLIRTKHYTKSLKNLPKRDIDMIEAAVDRLEGDWTGLDFVALQGQAPWWRLSIGHYRVLCRVFVEVENGKQAKHIQIISAEEVKRRSSTTYRNRGH